MLYLHFLLVSLTTLTTSTPLPDPSNIPVSLRECSTEKVPVALIPPFTSWLRDQPSATIATTMGTATYQHTINGTCLQARVYNWSCDHILNVTGPGVANAVGSIADQCDGHHYTTGETAGPMGFGYYKDLDTGYEFTKHLWVVTGGCTDHMLKSACSPGA